MSFSGDNEYSTFLVAENVGVAELWKVAEGTDKTVQRLQSGKYQRYMCKDESFVFTKKTVMGVTLMAIMGDSFESGLKVHIRQHNVGRPVQVGPSNFQACSGQKIIE